MNVSGKNVQISIESITNFILEQWSIKVHTGKPMSNIRIVASTKDDHNKIFHSTATFSSDKNGVVDLAVQSPIEGDYESVDAMGLIWSMKCKGKKEGMYVKHKSEPITFEIDVYDSNNKLIAHTSFTKTFESDEVIREELIDDMVGTVYYPNDAVCLPAIVIVGGSDASVHEAAASILASQGFVVLALAYFGKEGLPKGIDNIPLEYVDKAFRYLESKSFVDQTKLGIIGHSRGSELALLYARHFSKVKSVIVTAPSSVIFSGLLNYQPIAKPAWTFQGKPFNYFEAVRTMGDLFSFFYHWIFRKPYSGLIPINRNLQDEQKVDAHSIPVQDIQAPMMFFAGTDDHVQPAVFFTKRMEGALAEHAFSKQNRFIYHKGAGHFSAFPCSLPNLPQTVGDTNFKMTMIFGGTRKINAKTAQQTWEDTLEFLEATLTKLK